MNLFISQASFDGTIQLVEILKSAVLVLSLEDSHANYKE